MVIVSLAGCSLNDTKEMVQEKTEEKIWVTVHERYEEGPHEFSLNFENATTVEMADLVVYGTIYTVEDENNDFAEAFAVKDGKNIYVGNEDGIKPFIKEGKTKIIIEQGKV